MLWGFSQFALGNLFLPGAKQQTKWNATGELVCRPGMDAGAWNGEKMETLHDRLGRKKTSSEQESPFTSWAVEILSLTSPDRV